MYRHHNRQGAELILKAPKHDTFIKWPTWGHVTVWKIYISIFMRFIANKANELDRLLTSGWIFSTQTLKSSQTSYVLNLLNHEVLFLLCVSYLSFINIYIYIHYMIFTGHSAGKIRLSICMQDSAKSALHYQILHYQTNLIKFIWLVFYTRFVWDCSRLHYQINLLKMII